MEGIRIRRQAGRPRPSSAIYRTVSTADRLANLVRGHGESPRIPVDAAFCLETFAQRPRHVVGAREQSISRSAAHLRARAALSLSLCAAWRERLVASRVSRRMVAAILGR